MSSRWCEFGITADAAVFAIACDDEDEYPPMMIHRQVDVQVLVTSLPPVTAADV